MTEPVTEFTVINADPVSRQNAARHIVELQQERGELRTQLATSKEAREAAARDIDTLQNRVSELLQRSSDLSFELDAANERVRSQAAQQQISARAAGEAEQKYDALVEALQEEANNRGWCSEYDDFAAEHGLPSREREYTVTARVVVEFTRPVNANDEESASEQIQQMSTRELEMIIYDLPRSEINVTDTYSIQAELS